MTTQMRPGSLDEARAQIKAIIDQQNAEAAGAFHDEATAGELLGENIEAYLVDVARYGKHYPQTPWASLSESTQGRLNQEMRFIGNWRRKMGDTDWEWDHSRPWEQPVLDGRLLIELIAARWNKAEHCRRMTACVLRYHYAEHRRPRAYRVLEVLNRGKVR